MLADFDALNRYIIPDYAKRPPFSSFLPGIAGPLGIPLWVFYVNRGQGVAGFGIESKDHPLMEFYPAQRAYQIAPLLGFRTFLRGRRPDRIWHYEPFSPWRNDRARRTMFIGLNEFEIEESHAALGLQVNVLYFVLPGEPFAALVRQLTLQNTASAPLSLEVLDGLPVLVPYGLTDEALKRMGRTMEAWMEVVHHGERVPFYRIKATYDDTLHVRTVQAGNYALAFLDGELLPVIVDPTVLFGPDTSLTFPHLFRASGLAAMIGADQVTENRTPCAFFGTHLELEPGEARQITSLYGHVARWEIIASHLPALLASGAMRAKLEEARCLALELTDSVRTTSASPLFDSYCRQTFLDNLLRGGYPLLLAGKHVYYVYSRRHGDLERDYNYFVLAPEFYSQGNGNYRDVNQNRRNDVFFLPQTGEFNIRLFLSLIQADGYNPLVLQGSTFTMPKEAAAKLLSLVKNPEPLRKILNGHFTPGQLLAAGQQAELTLPPLEFLNRALVHACQHFHAEHGEGYWTDHWTYNLDLIEAFLAIYPEKLRWLLFEAEPLPFYDSAVGVAPRRERFVLDEGCPRQSNALVVDREKAALIASRAEEAFWTRTRQGKGEVFRLPVVSKLVLITLLKYAALDPSGLGVLMEAGRPGWYDALNGLPALFGSSLAETCQLLRWVNFLLSALKETMDEVELPKEAIPLLQTVDEVLTNPLSPFEDWERRTDALEAYRWATHGGFDGATEKVHLLALLSALRASLQDSIHRAEALAGGFPPTYFVHLARSWELTGRTDAYGRPLIRVTDFEPIPLPPFLEGVVCRMRTLDPEGVRALHVRVRDSELFDRKLKMYRLNVNLSHLSHEIGRARAFTPGWLENESIWLHMEFKYLLDLLRAGLWEEFFTDLKICLPAFMDPAIYGRSPLENSSFIVSSVHPDSSLHGRGFVARLSGSTAEFLSIWQHMTVGPRPFVWQDGVLMLDLRPALPGWLFREDGTFSFRFLNSCQVTYHHPSRQNICGWPPKYVLLHPRGGDPVRIDGIISGKYAEMVRSGQVEAIEAFF